MPTLERASSQSAADTDARQRRSLYPLRLRLDQQEYLIKEARRRGVYPSDVAMELLDAAIRVLRPSTKAKR
jgi:hypothetical protein